EIKINWAKKDRNFFKKEKIITSDNDWMNEDDDEENAYIELNFGLGAFIVEKKLYFLWNQIDKVLLNGRYSDLHYFIFHCIRERVALKFIFLNPMQKVFQFFVKKCAYITDNEDNLFICALSLNQILDSDYFKNRPKSLPIIDEIKSISSKYGIKTSQNVTSSSGIINFDRHELELLLCNLNNRMDRPEEPNLFAFNKLKIKIQKYLEES
ncbi:MAG: hypothetical protein MHPSP_002338, partial [Paramarteilia canceri]